MRHAHIDTARTPAEKGCVPLAVGSRAMSDCTALYTRVAACPHSATKLSTYMCIYMYAYVCTYTCISMQTAVATQDLTGSHLYVSSCV